MSEALTASGAHEIVLDEQLLIGSAQALQEALIAAASEGGAVIIDGSAVAQVHTPALQLLVAFARQAEEWGLSMQWEGVSTEMQEVADLVGLSGALGFPSTRMTTSED